MDFVAYNEILICQQPMHNMKISGKHHFYSDVDCVEQLSRYVHMNQRILEGKEIRQQLGERT